MSEPVAASDGSLIVTADAPGVPEARYCVLFRWLPGKFLDAGLNAKAIQRVGIFLARLHQYSQNFIPPKGFVRSQLNENRLFPSLPRLLPAKSQAVLQTAAKKIRQQMRCIKKAPEFFGLIHGDLNFSNCKFHQGEIQVFDFDDCGWGYYSGSHSEYIHNALKIALTGTPLPSLGEG
ncbi:MAG: phosphotransferase [Stigonema ocellatum SAG 48.90 = DSM 106950]|nr:phosphotransferase [Stigonema ocellatum SAG 48.90 = DSM 106950]